MQRALVLIFILTALIAAGISGCRARTADRLPAESASDSFPGPARLSINSGNGYVKVIVSDPWQGAEGITEEFILVRRDSLPPPGSDSLHVIKVPVQRVVCMSTTHVAMIEALGREKAICGISGTSFVFSENVRKMIASGAIGEVGYDGTLNTELLLKLKPELIILYGVGNESESLSARLRDLGLKVIMNADYLETDPLKKLSWLRLFGCLFGEEEKADSIVSSETLTYGEISTLVSEKADARPKVLLGLPYRDTWFISPGNSFAAKLLSDAGGEYLWKESVSEISMPLALETVYLRALEADFWLNTGSAAEMEEIAAYDNRLTALPCFVNGRLYNNNRRMGPGGGNDYWESGAVHPSSVLRDIASILHPELFPGYEPVYYRRLK